MTKRNKILLFGNVFLLLVLSGLLSWWWFYRSEQVALEEAYQYPSASGTQEQFLARLYFLDSISGELTVENRSLAKPPTMEAQVKLVINEMVSGPKQKGYKATIPADTQLQDFYLDAQGCAYLDFDASLKRNHPGGSYAETLTIASLVSTLINNFPQVKQVKLLINGAECETLAGHIDTRFPFTSESLQFKAIAIQ